jgi:capsid protein
MSLHARLESLVLRLASEFKTIHSQIGALSELGTDEKQSIVAAINALQQRIQTLGEMAFIDDTDLEASSTALSASKVSDLLRSLKTELLNGTENALETFQALQDALLNDQTGMQALLLSLNQRVRFDAQQNLTPAQQQQARQNIGAVSLAQIGDLDADFVAIFEQTLESAV